MAEYLKNTSSKGIIAFDLTILVSLWNYFFNKNKKQPKITFELHTSANYLDVMRKITVTITIGKLTNLLSSSKWKIMNHK